MTQKAERRRPDMVMHSRMYCDFSLTSSITCSGRKKESTKGTTHTSTANSNEMVKVRLFDGKPMCRSSTCSKPAAPMAVAIAACTRLASAPMDDSTKEGSKSCPCSFTCG